MIKTDLSDGLTLVVPGHAERYEGPGVLFATTASGPIYLEGEPAALQRLANRINEKFPCD